MATSITGQNKSGRSTTSPYTAGSEPKGNKVTVEGVNVATKHQAPKKQGEEGGIIKVDTPLYASKVQLVCPKCGKAIRVSHKVVEKTVAGKKKMKSVRVCPKCGAEI